MELLELIKVLILGILEGVTEWLPISSTGHMILLGELLSPPGSQEFFDLKNDDYVKAKKAFAEFWGNVSYASKCNSFGSMGISLPLDEALQLRGEIGAVIKVVISADTVLVGGVGKLSFSIENTGEGFKTTGRLDLIAVRSEQDDDVLGLPLSTVAAMYKRAK